MEKLELKHIAPYLPYKLRVLVGEKERNLTAVSLDSPFVFVTSWLESIEKEMKNINSIKPILRPLSQLTQEIEHNGERFVPIVEVFKLHNKTGIRVFPSSENYELDHYSHCVIYDDKHVFGYSNYGSFVAFTKEKNSHLVINQNELFEKLYEWHFDVFGLIEKGLAVRKD